MNNIRQSQRTLPDNTEHSQQTDTMLPVGFELTILMRPLGPGYNRNKSHNNCVWRLAKEDNVFGHLVNTHVAK